MGQQLRLETERLELVPFSGEFIEALELVTVEGGPHNIALRECRVGCCLDVAVDLGRLGAFEHPLGEHDHDEVVVGVDQPG